MLRHDYRSWQTASQVLNHQPILGTWCTHSDAANTWREWLIPDRRHLIWELLLGSLNTARLQIALVGIFAQPQWVNMGTMVRLSCSYMGILSVHVLLVWKPLLNHTGCWWEPRFNYCIHVWEHLFNHIADAQPNLTYSFTRCNARSFSQFCLEEQNKQYRERHRSLCALPAL